MFQLTDQEYNGLRFQNETTNFKMKRSLHYVFTEQGVAMLSAIINSEVSVTVSIKIMKTL